MATRRHHTLGFKIMRHLANALLLSLLLVAMSLTVVSAPGHAQGPKEEVLYEENFDDDEAQGWELGKGWGWTPVCSGAVTIRGQLHC